MRFDRTRPRRPGNDAVPRPGPLAPLHAPRAPGRAKSLRAGLCRIQGEAAVPSGAPPGARSAGGSLPSLPGHLQARLPRSVKPVHSPHPLCS